MSRGSCYYSLSVVFAPSARRNEFTFCASDCAFAYLQGCWCTGDPRPSPYPQQRHATSRAWQWHLIPKDFTVSWINETWLMCLCTVFQHFEYTLTLCPFKPLWSLYVPPAVTICTASLTFTNYSFCTHSVFMCFVWTSEQTAIISLYSINWLVFIIETESVYCAVRTGSLSEIAFRP